MISVWVAALAWTTAAHAQSSSIEGRACEATYDCGDLHCVDGRCISLDNDRPHEQPVAQTTSGSSAMFGDGTGYVAAVVVGDVAATAVVGVLVALTAATGQAGFGVAALFPTTLTAPILHAAYGRPIPALISFLGWASVPPTSVFFGALASVGSFNAGLGLIAGTAIASGCAVALTALDAYFARTVNLRDEHPSVTWAPTVAPLPGGFSASIAGAF